MGFFSDLFSQYAVVGPDAVPSYDTLGQLMSAAGYTGPVTEDYQEWRVAGGDAGDMQLYGATRTNPGVQRWLDSQGYSLRQMQGGGKWSTAVVDSQGNPISQADYQEHGIPNILKYGVPAFLGAVGGGAALTGAGLLGGGASAGGAASAGAVPSAAGTGLAGGFSLPGAEAVGAGLDLSGAFGGADALSALGAAAPLGDFTLAGGGGNTPWLTRLSQLGSGLGGTSAAGIGTLGGYGGLLSQLLNVGSGIYGMKLAGDAREASDPFAQYRPAYGAALANLESNPSQIQTRPGFQAGLETINRNMASRGYLGSGNQTAALMRYSGDFYNQEAQRLAGLAGAGQAPGAGQFGAADLASRSLGSIGYGVAPQTQPNYNSNQLLQLALSQLMRG